MSFCVEFKSKPWGPYVFPSKRVDTKSSVHPHNLAGCWWAHKAAKGVGMLLMINGSDFRRSHLAGGSAPALPKPTASQGVKGYRPEGNNEIKRKIAA